MDTNSTLDQVKEIRIKKADLVSQLPIKKVIVGGYDCGEVEEFIRSLKENIQHSENAFFEKLEEYSSTCEMYEKEREKLSLKLRETQKNLEEYKEETKKEIETSVKKIEQDEASVTLIKKENESLKDIIQKLRQQIENHEESQELVEQIEAMEGENKALHTKIATLAEENQKLFSENSLLINESQKMKKSLEKSQMETSGLKESINKVVIAKRNNAMETNMKVYAYQQNHTLAADRISSNVQEIVKMIDVMRAEASQLLENTRLDSED